MPILHLSTLPISLSKDLSLHKVFARNTRGSHRLVFKTDQYEGTLYKRSPYFTGTNLWNDLSTSDIELPDVFSFKKRLKDRQQSSR